MWEGVVYDELNEVVLDYLKVLSRKLPRKVEENQEKID
jgi:hypothetical protein